ncbi:MAG: hypothetical protein HYX27_19315 [Acidobacteria bacterium]|nr:hypothetical protein [Acidobacteriota bacterium]
MTDIITAGSILVAGGKYPPKSFLLQSESDSNGWAAIKDARATFEKTVQEAGWTFFFMAGEIKTTVFGLDKQKALRAALKRLIADVKSQHCNSIEITRVMSKSFLKVPYVSVSAHPRHLQKGMCFSANEAGSDPALVTQTQSTGRLTAS